MSAIEQRLSSLGIQLPQPPPPGGNYVGAVRFGNLVYLSGHGPLQMVAIQSKHDLAQHWIQLSNLFTKRTLI